MSDRGLDAGAAFEDAAHARADLSRARTRLLEDVDESKHRGRTRSREGLEAFGDQRRVHRLECRIDRSLEGQTGGAKVSAAAEPSGRFLHVDASVAAQADAHLAVIGFEERGDVDAFDSAQV